MLQLIGYASIYYANFVSMPAFSKQSRSVSAQ